jgi:hypothetical protein
MSFMTRLEALRAATGHATKTVEQAELKATCAATACDVQAVEMAEAANFPLSLQQNSCTGNVSKDEIALIDELNAKLEAAFAEPKDASCREENAIAARVAELHDRLGGFIKPSLPQQPVEPPIRILERPLRGGFCISGAGARSSQHSSLCP